MATTPQLSEASPPLEKQTTVGNYFVSNYPPFSFWKPEFVQDAIAALDRPLLPIRTCRAKQRRRSTPLGVYLHIPFCRKRCHFCYFKVYTDKDSAAIRGYIEAALRELALYAAKPALAGRKANFVYFGGGTPSYLSVDQLAHLTQGMKKLVPWDEAEEVTFECEPGTLTSHKLEAIREMGVTRLSLGVENFDDHILEINGRAHHSKEIARAYSFARELGFPQINIDLIAGMVEETEANWRECVRKTIAHVPRQRHHLPDGSPLQHRHLPGDESRRANWPPRWPIGRPSAPGSAGPLPNWKKPATPSAAPTPLSKIRQTPASFTATASGRGPI